MILKAAWIWPHAADITSRQEGMMIMTNHIEFHPSDMQQVDHTWKQYTDLAYFTCVSSCKTED